MIPFSSLYLNEMVWYAYQKNMKKFIGIKSNIFMASLPARINDLVLS